MELQIALDAVSPGRGIQIVTAARDYVDIIEMGTGFLLMNGFHPISVFKELFPEKKILADTKIMDGGYHIAKTAFEAGADIVTACCCAEEATVRGVNQAAKDMGGEVLVDLIALDDYAEQAKLLNPLKIDYVCAHMAVDTEQDNDIASFFEKLNTVHFDAKISLAGGITIERLPEIMKYQPDVLIIGRAITEAADPAEAAKTFKMAK